LLDKAVVTTGSIVVMCRVHVRCCLYRVGRNTGLFLQVHNSCMYWCRKMICLSQCSALYLE